MTHTHSSKKHNQQGFTLIELMVVIVILGLLASIVVPNIMSRTEQAKVEKARTDIAALESALKLYRLDNGKYPTVEQGLKSLVQKPEVDPIPKKWKTNGYLDKKKVPMDPWGNEYVYLSPGAHGSIDLTSLGADGEPGGEDEYNRDINNWETE